MKTKNMAKKKRRRVNIDKEIWEQVTQRGPQVPNFSRLVSNLLGSYVDKSTESKYKAGNKISIDITIEDSLWENAMRIAHRQDSSLSQVLRKLLRNYVHRRVPSRRTHNV